MHPEIARAIELVKENNWSIEQLYMFWWSGVSSDGKREAIAQALHNPIPSKRVLTEGESFVFSVATRVIVVGYRENIFHWLPFVEFHLTWEEALRALKG